MYFCRKFVWMANNLDYLFIFVRKIFNKKDLFDGWVSKNCHYDCFAIASIGKCYPKTRIPSVNVGENNQRGKTNKDKKNERSSYEESHPMQGNPDSRNILAECGKRLKESGIPLTIGVRNPNSTDKKSGIQYLESESKTWNPESETALDSLAWRDRSIFNLHDNKAKNDHKRVAHYYSVGCFVCWGGFEKLSFYKQPFRKYADVRTSDR